MSRQPARGPLSTSTTEVPGTALKASMITRSRSKEEVAVR